MIILVLDDDRSLKSMTAKSLRNKGHTVHEAESATWALHLMTSHPEIEAAILDVQADGKNVGEPTARMIHRMNPHVAILLVSGAPRPTDDFHFLAKPYDVTDLVNALTAILKR
jgi:DNA-binding response OmpR family regulator